MAYFSVWTEFGMAAFPLGVARAIGAVVVGAGLFLIARAAGLE